MKFLSFKNYLIISRPIVFPLLFLCLLVALFFSTTSFSTIHLLYIFFLVLFLPFFTFSINDLEDYDSDKLNIRKKNILFGKHIPNIKDYTASIYLINSFIFLFLFSYTFFFFNLFSSTIIFLLLLFLLFYSLKPIRLKEIFLIDFFSNAVITFLTFFLIYSLFNPPFSISLKIVFFSLAISSYHLLAAQIDVSYDKQANHNSTATKLNHKYLVCLICLILNLPLFFLNLSSSFKYLGVFNFLLIFLFMFFPKLNKVYFFLIFFFGWILIALFYIF